MKSEHTTSILLVTAYPTFFQQRPNKWQQASRAHWKPRSVRDNFFVNLFPNYADSFVFDLERNDSYASMYTEGQGHLVRALRLANAMGCDVLVPAQGLGSTLGQDADKPSIVKKTSETKESWVENVQGRRYSFVTTIGKHYDLIIVDCRSISLTQLRLYKEHSSLVLGLDIGGKSRKAFPYLIDTLPHLSRHRPNQIEYGIPTLPTLSHPHRNLSQAESPLTKSNDELLWQRTLKSKKILFYLPVSTLLLIEPLFEELAKRGLQCTIVSDRNSDFAARLHSIDAITFIQASVYDAIDFSQYDLLVSYFGLSIYEALYQKIPVILYNPSHYHHALSRRAGFMPSMRVNISQSSRLHNIGRHKSQVYAKCKRVLLEYLDSDVSVKQKRLAQLAALRYSLRHTLVDKLQTIHKELRASSAKDRNARSYNPYLSELAVDRAAYRDEDKTIFSCATTGAEYQVCVSARHQYNKYYFQSSYHQQYGKTYLQDYANILNRARKRMLLINNYLPTYEASYFLDLGCAFGAMLYAAKEAGYEPIGVDLQQEPVEYVRRTFSISAERVDLNTMFHAHPALKYYQNQISVLSANFVLEHLDSMDHFLYSAKKLLRVGGVLSLSLPNAHCMRRYLQFRRYMSQSPNDHSLHFSPHTISRLLNNAGFKVCKIKKTGRHPERIVNSPILKPLVAGLLSIMRDGETFELIAKREW